MYETLYDLMIKTENLEKILIKNINKCNKPFRNLLKINMPLLEISKDNVPAFQKELIIRCSEDNDILFNAIDGGDSISESLSDLSEINKGKRKFLPRIINKERNKRLNEMSQLIRRPSHLYSNGIIYSDNIITTTLEVGAIIGGITFIFANNIFPEIYQSETPETLTQKIEFCKTIMPSATAIISPIIGLISNVGRFDSYEVNQDCIKQAKHLDKKIKILFHNNSRYDEPKKKTYLKKEEMKNITNN